MFETRGLKKVAAQFVCRILRDYNVTPDYMLDHYTLLDSMKYLLVCLPFDSDEFSESIPAVESLFDKFPETEITAVAPSDFKCQLGQFPFKRILEIREYNLNYFKLPNRNFRSSVKSNKFDVAIDFNTKELLFSSILCAVCGARVRVGFASDRDNSFFNFQVHTKSRCSSRGKYLTLVRYLTR